MDHPVAKGVILDGGSSEQVDVFATKDLAHTTSWERLTLQERLTDAIIDQVFSNADPYDFAPRSIPAGERDKLSGDAAVLTHQRSDGLVLSAISDRTFLRWLTGHLMPLDGKRIFEIGTGTGYLASILKKLCGPLGTVTGCEIIPELFDLSVDTLRNGDNAGIEVHFGDFLDIIPTLGSFDVLVGTSSFSEIRSCIISACNSNGGKIALPIEIPGGGDCYTIFERHEDMLRVVVAKLTVSVPTTGQYSDQAIWAPPIGRHFPDFHDGSKTIVSLGAAPGHAIHGTLAFRSFLFFHEPLFAAFSLGNQNLSRVNEMTFGIVREATQSCCLQHGGELILMGPETLELTNRFVQWRDRWEREGRPSLADVRYEIDLRDRPNVVFRAAFKKMVVDG